MYWTDGKATLSLQCPPSSESRAGYECVKSRERRKGLIYRTERPGFFLGLPTQLSFFPFPAQSEEEECSSLFPSPYDEKEIIERGNCGADCTKQDGKCWSVGESKTARFSKLLFFLGGGS